MIEIPEAVNLAKQINKTLKGKKITNVVAAEHPHKFAWYYNEPKGYEKILKEKTITKATTKGSFVEIHADDATILFTEGINLRYIEDAKKLPKKHQLLIQFDDETILCASVQMYGGLICFIGDNYSDKYYNTAKEKPSPLTNEFNREYFDSIATIAETKKSISLKALIATEQRIPGLGNGVLQDILSNAKLHPKQKYNALNEAQKQALFNSIKNTLKEMTDKGGRNTEKNLFSEPGAYKTLVGKNTINKPCRVCNTLIVKASYMGGSIYFCPECQKL